jgi:hypothetical protein
MRLSRKIRHGMTIIEATLVMSVLALFLFGILEYARFLMVLHVTHNAARDAARYASVNQDKPATFDTTGYTDGAGRYYPSIRDYTALRMAGVQRQLADYEMAVYPVDSSSASATPPVVRAKAKTGTPPGQYPDPFDPSDPRRPPWNQATYPEGIAVSIRGTYKPLLPGFLLMPSEIPVSITFVSSSGG